MHEKRLLEIQKRANQTLIILPGNFPSQWASDIRHDVNDLVAEVERLQGRLKDVERLVHEPAQYGEDISAARVLEAVEGHRAATLEEFRAKILGGVSDSVLCKWINTGKARVTSDGKFIIDDLTGLSMEVIQGKYGARTL